MGLKNENIKETFNYLTTIGNILTKEIKTVEGDRNRIDKIVPEDIKGHYSRKERDAQSFAKNLSDTYYEASVVTLVACFEKIVFAKYYTASGEIKKVVKAYSPQPLDYYKSREKFVNGNIDRLQSIIDLVEGQIDNRLLENLKRIKGQRDYLAHGKRFGKAPAINLNLSEVAEILDKVIMEIER
jgi:hypothetical protein